MLPQGEFMNITNKDFKEKRTHPRMPIMHDIIEPINLLCKDRDSDTEVSIPAILADLSAAGMRLVTFLKVPKGYLDIHLSLPSIGDMHINGKTSWIKQKGGVYTAGIQILEISKASADKINKMSEDFNDCDTRILLKLPEVCVENCKANSLCNKLQKDETLFK
jgi:hypothetical protein